jgi:opacity protein-like surface antigen
MSRLCSFTGVILSIEDIPRYEHGTLLGYGPLSFLEHRMKKLLLTLSLAALAGLAFGLDVAGTKIEPSVGAYVGLGGWNSSFKASLGGASVEQSGGYTNLSLGAFFDATYLEGAVAVDTQLGKAKTKLAVTGSSTVESESDTQILALDFRLLAKYPFAFAPVTVYPLVGFDYSLNLNFKDKSSASSDAKNEANDFFVDLGAGLDYPITSNVYIRGEGVFAINLTPTAKANKDYYTGLGLTYSDFGYKFGANVGVGYKF